MRQECAENGEVRRVSSRVDLHRMGDMNLLVLADAVFELDCYYEMSDYRGRPFALGRFNQAGVSRKY